MAGPSAAIADGPGVLLLAVVVGYALGALSPAALVGRRAGIDVTAAGSGNPGAANVGRLLGPRLGVAVGALDVLKGLLPAAAFGLITEPAGLAAGLAAVVGHVTSPLLRGHGGKGVATAAGAVLGARPLWGLFLVAAWAIVVAIWRWVALGSVAAAAALPVMAFLTDSQGAVRAWAVALSALVLLRHRANLVAWWRGRRRRR